MISGSSRRLIEHGAAPRKVVAAQTKRRPEGGQLDYFIKEVALSGCQRGLPRAAPTECTAQATDRGRVRTALPPVTALDAAQHSK